MQTTAAATSTDLIGIDEIALNNGLEVLEYVDTRVGDRLTSRHLRLYRHFNDGGPHFAYGGADDFG